MQEISQYQLILSQSNLNTGCTAILEASTQIAMMKTVTLHPKSLPAMNFPFQ